MPEQIVHHVPDSFAWLHEQPGDGVVDVTITDPPYNAHVQGNMTSGTAMKRHVESGSTKSIPKLDLPFAPLPGYDFAADLVRITRRWALVFCAIEDFGEYRRALGEGELVRGAIWTKPNSMGQLTGDRPAAACEGIAVLHRKGKKAWNGRGSYGFWVCNGTRGEKERHPNQKPLNLCLELVAKFSNRGETVFDPFCGSGRIGEACKMLGRGYIGLDSDAAWVERARARISATTETRTDDECKALCRFKGQSTTTAMMTTATMTTTEEETNG